MQRRSSTGLLAVLVLALLPAAPAAAAPLPSDPQLVLDTGFHTDAIRAVSSDAAGSLYLTASPDKTARLWDAGGRLLRVLRVPQAAGYEGGLYAGALTPDGRTAALGRLAVGLNGRSGVRLLDWAAGRELGRDEGYALRLYQADFSPDGRWLATSSGDGRLRLYALAPAFRKCGEHAFPEGRWPIGLAWSPDSRLVAAGEEISRVTVFAVEGEGLQPAFEPDMAGLASTGKNLGLSRVAFSRDGGVLAAGGSYGPQESLLLVWPQGGRGARSVWKLGLGDTIFAVHPLPDGGFLVGNGDPRLVRTDARGGTVFAQGPQIASFRAIKGRLRIDAAGTRAGFQYDYSYNYANPDAVFSVPERSLVREAPRDLLLPDTGGLEVKDWASRNPSLDGKPLLGGNNETGLSLAVAADRQSFLFGTSLALYRFGADGGRRWMQAVPNCWSAAVSADGRLAVAALGDGTIRWFRFGDGAPLLTFFPHRDGKRWIAWTPSGYYDASPGAEELIGWHLNRGLDAAADFFPAGQFRSRFYRPGVVGLVLETADEKLALAQAVGGAGADRAAAASLKDVLPPVVSILSPAEGAAVSGTPVTVRYSLRSPSGEPVTAVRFLVDGRPVSASRGLVVTAVEGRDVPAEAEVAIPAADCTVSVIAENRHASSAEAKVRLRWAGAAAGGFSAKPRLYVLAVGVGAYQNPALRLGFPAKDAADFASAMKAQKDRLYREVEARVLTDAGASRDEIMDGLEWVQRQTTAKDVAAVFFAGHGVNDSTGTYYFLPVGADPERLKRTGVPYTDVVTTLRAIPGKALFFIDTCHSGNILGGRRGAGDVNAMVNELASADNGAVVFTASTGSQYSLENAEWKNGAFTKALVEGLGGAADYQKNGRITLKMLDLYISERVKELTRGAQAPTTIIPASVPDFPVALRP